VRQILRLTTHEMLAAMDETDPFGRDKGEDPLAEMGWASGGTATPDIGPGDIAQPETPDVAAQLQQPQVRADQLRQQQTIATPGPAPRSRYTHSAGSTISGGIPGQGRRNLTGCSFALIGLIVGLGAIGAFVVPAIIDAVDSVEKSIDDATPDIDVPKDSGGGGGGGGNGGGKREKQTRPPRGLEQASLLRRGNLAPALVRLKRITKSSQVRLIRIDAESIVVQTVASGGRAKLARATWRGDASLLSTSAGGGGSTFSWSEIDASAPNRIVRAMTKGRSSRSFDYLVLIDAVGLRWSAFLKNGRGTFQAEPDGRGVSKVG
jgi:hypothetical protein